MKIFLIVAIAIVLPFSAAAQAKRAPAPAYELACPSGYSPMQQFGKTLNENTGQWRANMCIAGDGSGKIICQMGGCANGGPAVFSSLNGVLTATMYPGADIGAQINAAYAALPATGGEIYIPAGACLSFSTPIVFGTLHKTVTLRGAGGSATCLHYTGTTGVAITVNVGAQSRINRLEDFELDGSGVGNSTTGIVIGGANDSGTESMRLSRMMVQNFGLGLTVSGGNTFFLTADQIHLNNNGQNFASAVGAENNRFVDSVFSLDTPGTTGTLANSVALSSSSEYTFLNCSFDNAQLALSGNATAHVIGGHFENPAQGSYDYFVAGGNTLELSNILFLQDNSSTFANNRFGNLTAGTLNIFGGTAFSPVALGSFVAITGATNIVNLGFHLNSTITAVISGSTTGINFSVPNDSTGTVATAGDIYFGHHLLQLSANRFAGTCTMAATTTCTFTIGAAYGGTPLCIVSNQDAATSFGRCALSGTTVTVTASASNSNKWGAVLIGNPN